MKRADVAAQRLARRVTQLETSIPQPAAAAAPGAPASFPAPVVHVVGAAGEIGFSNGWVAFGAPYAPPRYYIDALGFVVLEGLAKSGGPANSTIFTLPAGYRPGPNDHVYKVTTANNLFAVIEVFNSGAVLPQVINSSSSCSLWGIRFRPGA